MKVKARSCSTEAVRAKKTFGFLAITALAAACCTLVFAIWLGLKAGPRFFVLLIPAIAFFIVARSAWHSGKKFYREWMQLREETLGYAKEAEGRL
jgi:Flp pilus assembly protein TadB